MRFLRKVAFGLLVFVASSAAAGLVVRRKVLAYGGRTDERFSVVAVMAGAVLKSTTSGLVEGRALAVMGGVELDLLDAKLAPDALLVLRAVAGGIDVIVPSGWRIEVIARSVVCGAADLTHTDDLPDDAPVLLIDAFVVMGGIAVHRAEVV